MYGDATGTEDPIFAAIRELQTLSRMPMPQFRAPPWDAIRAALPPNCVLPEQPVRVLVDLDIDSTGTVTLASVDHIPDSLAGQRAVAVCVGPDGALLVQNPMAAAGPDVARAVAIGHLDARFTPAERDGQPVSVRQFRMSIEVLPAMLRGDAEQPGR